MLLTKYPECAKALDKYRINPGNVGAGQRRDEQFSTICKVARDNGKPVRIGVNGGSLNQELVMESRKVPGLFFIGEVVDVTGHLGGFNFQWAWASAAAAGRAL